jgi:PBSX family phage terminase large subunit
MKRLTDLIAPSFYGLHKDVKDERHTYYMLNGGRGSGKSTFVSVEIILGIIKDKTANAVVLRKVGVNIKDSVYSQLQWAIEALGVSHLWKEKLSPLELVYIPTGQRIIFRGADDPKKIKSTKFTKGYCKYVWYEECDEFAGMEEIRTINQSLLRGGEKFFVFYSYNPPKSVQNWINAESMRDEPSRIVHHSTYLTVPVQWLGEQFILDAEALRESKPESYAHEYLGEVTGTGGEVFSNVKTRTISAKEIAEFDNIARGLDWGFASDPLHYTVNHYDKTRRILYIFYEIHATRMSNTTVAELIKKENPDNDLVVCDSAEPKSISELNSYGIRCTGAKKGPDSRDYGIKWLQDLNEIVIDPVRCPNTAREFLHYELKKDKEGNFIPRFPDVNDHSIDAVRYSRVFNITKPKEKPKPVFNFETEKPKVNVLIGGEDVVI